MAVSVHDATYFGIVFILTANGPCSCSGSGHYVLRCDDLPHRNLPARWVSLTQVSSAATSDARPPPTGREGRRRRRPALESYLGSVSFAQAEHRQNTGRMAERSLHNSTPRHDADSPSGGSGRTYERPRQDPRMDLTISPLTAGRWPALEGPLGNATTSNGCRCKYRRTGPRYRDRPRTGQNPAYECSLWLVSAYVSQRMATSTPLQPLQGPTVCLW